ncbi:hypothetical protein [Streptomyces sp. 351MFTsu5.1]|nr:hypothetical protein [Streptomyces sp. 351MFTsu5.1]
MRAVSGQGGAGQGGAEGWITQECGLVWKWGIAWKCGIAWK